MAQGSVMLIRQVSMQQTSIVTELMESMGKYVQLSPASEREHQQRHENMLDHLLVIDDMEIFLFFPSLSRRRWWQIVITACSVVL